VVCIGTAWSARCESEAPAITIPKVENPTPEEYKILFDEAVKLSGDAKFLESNAILEKLYKANPQDTDVHFFIAKNIYYHDDTTPVAFSEEEKEKLAAKVIKHSNECLKINPKSVECHLSLGLGMVMETSYSGVFTQVDRAGSIETVWEKALTLMKEQKDPVPPYVAANLYMALGVFYRVLPTSWIVSIAAGVSGDKEKSYKLLEMAVQKQPDRLILQHLLGVSYLCYGEDEDEEEFYAKAKTIFEKVQTMQANTISDEVDKKHASVLMSHPDSACGYSRASFQAFLKANNSERAPSSTEKTAAANE
jgi:tetratricopeptide (TPR) repeat protein